MPRLKGPKTAPISGNGLWWDVEDEYYVHNDLRTIPQHKGLASAPALAQPHCYHYPLRPSQDQINQHDNDGIGGASPHTLPQPLGKNGRGGSAENASEPWKDLLLAFEEQKMSTSAAAPSSPRPYFLSTKPSHP
jgi:hypothetical protein